MPRAYLIYEVAWHFPVAVQGRVSCLGHRATHHACERLLDNHALVASHVVRLSVQKTSTRSWETRQEVEGFDGFVSEAVHLNELVRYPKLPLPRQLRSTEQDINTAKQRESQRQEHNVAHLQAARMFLISDGLVFSRLPHQLKSRPGLVAFLALMQPAAWECSACCMPGSY